MAYNNCLLDLPTYLLVNCLEYPKSGISGFGIFLPGHGVTDFSNETQWHAAISANKARVIGGCERGIRMEVTAGTPETVDNPSGCSTIPITTGYNHAANWEDTNVNSTNDQFYATLQTANSLVVALYLCKQDKLRVIDSDLVVTIPNMPLIDFSPKVLQKYQGSMAWFVSAGDLASTVTNVPDGIFC